ncbi:hypothetical protein [Natronolimnobius baerhuensis]|uniref:Uncharacterized protein n=1 Tax=Natronolimnobius baerhuensis TaxID=253108 RepID=A0A202EB67_9EURY|nr:hypothetical protein [Natronolimnobius baerhuensis]OVE85428.1 hypothetical protein B2G88_00945 [Natronolimnobius baerhuensis]
MSERRPQPRAYVAVGLKCSHRVVDVLASGAIIATSVTSVLALVVGVIYVAGGPASAAVREITFVFTAFAGGFLLLTLGTVGIYFLLYRIRGEHSHGGIIAGW